MGNHGNPWKLRKRRDTKTAGQKSARGETLSRLNPTALQKTYDILGNNEKRAKKKGTKTIKKWNPQASMKRNNIVKLG
jgi:hypothetical protein